MAKSMHTGGIRQARKAGQRGRRVGNQKLENPFPESDPKRNLWKKFLVDASRRLKGAAKDARRNNQRISAAFRAVIKAPGAQRKQLWKKAADTLRSLLPQRSWPDTAPTNSELVRMQMEASEAVQEAVLRRFDTLACEALERFIARKEEIDRYAPMLGYLVRYTEAVVSSPSSRFLERLRQQQQRWEEIGRQRSENAAVPARRWNIGVRGDREGTQGAVTAYEHLAVDFMDVRGVSFRHTFQAADALLDEVAQYHWQRSSAYASNWRIVPLGMATAQYCSWLRMRALKEGNEGQAQALGEVKQQLLHLGRQGGESERDRRLGLYAVNRGVENTQKGKPPGTPAVGSPSSRTTDDGERVGTSGVSAAKGNINLLRAVGGELKETVTVALACRYGGVSRRAIEKALKKGSLASVGKGPNRRITVQSLLEYYPPENKAN